MQVTLQVTNVHDIGPSFLQPFTIFSVAENASVGQLDFRCPQPTDQDSSTFTFSFLNAASMPFQLDSSNGNVYLSAALNRTMQASYELQLLVNDGLLNATSWLHVTVTPVNQHSPVWSSSQLFFSVNELAPPNTVVASLVGAASDADSGVNGTLSYYVLADGLASAYFVIDPYTSLLYTTNWLSYQKVRLYSYFLFYKYTFTMFALSKNFSTETKSLYASLCFRCFWMPEVR